MINYYPTLIPIEKPWYIQEIWSPITDSMVKGIVPNRYMISTYGRFYDYESKLLRPTENVNGDDYTFVQVLLQDGSKKQFGIHILVARAFIPIKFKDQNEVNHIDGIRFHNWVWNLEWSTHQENLLHAVGTGLYGIGENQQNSIYTDNQIRMVCKYISEGYSPAEIVDCLKAYIPNINTHLIHDIKGGTQWQHISAEYDFSHMYTVKMADDLILDKNFVDAVCAIFEQYGRHLTPTQVLEKMGIKQSDITPTKFKNAGSLICRLKNKERYTRYPEVTSVYNY